MEKNKPLLCFFLMMLINMFFSCAKNKELMPQKDEFICTAIQLKAALDAANTSINFSAPISVSGKVADYPFSGTISTYGSTAIGQMAGSTQITGLQNLKLGLYRIPLKWNGGNVISSAGGGPTNISGITWIQKIRSLGAEPMVVIGGTTGDNDITVSDAVNLLNYFKNSGNMVKYWVIGNEPGGSIDTYCSLFNQIADAMKAADATIKIAGPAFAWYDLTTLRRFIQLSGAKADILDYHHYAMGVSYLTNTNALAETSSWENEVNELRNMIGTELPGAQNRIEIQVGEYNWSWRTANGYPGWNGEDRFYQGVATVWAASVAGHIAKAGGRGHQYSDLNSALGLTFEQGSDASHFGRLVNDPMPVYYGMLMFTGGNLFRPFGTGLVQASTSLSNVEVYASAAKNVVMINKDSVNSPQAAVQVSGLNAYLVDVWQTNKNAPFSAPQKVATITATNGSFAYNLPAYSVTTFVITASADQNLALAATATASGYVNSNESPDKAKDGNVSGTKWCDNINHDKWLKYDLGTTKTITKFVLNWEDWDINAKYKIQISNNGTNWTDIVTETANTLDPRTYNVNTSARYVRLFVAAADDTDAIRLMEFEVWGTP